MFNVGIALCQDRSSVSPLEAESSGDRWGARCSCGAAPCPGTSPCPDSVTGTCSSSCRWCTETAGTACSPRWSGTGVSPGSATWPSRGTGSGETWSAGTGSASGTARRSASRGWSRGSLGDWCSSHLEMDLEFKSENSICPTNWHELWETYSFACRVSFPRVMAGTSEHIRCWELYYWHSWQVTFHT